MARTALDYGEPEPPDPPSSCWCCGRSRADLSGLMGLGEHPEVCICFDCLDWLERGRRKKVQAAKQHYRDVRRFNRPALWRRVTDIFPGHRCGARTRARP